MSSNLNIEHEGLVKDADEKSVTIILSPLTTCSGCYSEKSCGMAGSQEKVVKVDGSFDVKPGDKVVVIMKQSLGYAALFLGYVLPLIIVLLFLIFLLALSLDELYSGMISLGILIPYYSGLFVYRKYIDKKFSFTLKI
jgi:sigma-E factor negative regulatory protein RseC